MSEGRYGVTVGSDFEIEEVTLCQLNPDDDAPHPLETVEDENGGDSGPVQR